MISFKFFGRPGTSVVGMNTATSGDLVYRESVSHVSGRAADRASGRRAVREINRLRLN